MEKPAFLIKLNEGDFYNITIFAYFFFEPVHLLSKSLAKGQRKVVSLKYRENKSINYEITLMNCENHIRYNESGLSASF
jgi:hypothetical protein